LARRKDRDALGRQGVRDGDRLEGGHDHKRHGEHRAGPQQNRKLSRVVQRRDMQHPVAVTEPEGAADVGSDP